LCQIRQGLRTRNSLANMNHHKKSPSKTQQDVKQNSKKGVQHEKAENFIARYANNVLFETSSWDLKLNFGELEQSGGNPNFVRQHTAITLPWPYVKLLVYLLRLNLITHEASHGRSIVPKGLVPMVPDKKPAESNVPDEVFAQARRLYEEFLSENPEANPDYQP